MNPFSNKNLNSHGKNQSPNNLENLNSPSASEIEDVEFQDYDPRVVKQVRNSFLFLVILGLVIGVFIAAGVVYIMNKFDINAQPGGNSPLEQLK